MTASTFLIKPIDWDTNILLLLMRTYTHNTLRTQQLVWQSAILSEFSEKGVLPPACLQDLLGVIWRWSGSETVFVCTVPTSESSFPQKEIHR